MGGGKTIPIWYKLLISYATQLNTQKYFPKPIKGRGGGEKKLFKINLFGLSSDKKAGTLDS